MPDSTSAGIITACATVIGGAITAGATVVVSLILRNTNRVESKVDEVHVMVNSNLTEVKQGRTDAQNYNRALILALQGAGVAVPADQSQGETNEQST